MSLRAGKAASFVLATVRAFPSLEPVAVQPVSAKVLGLPPRRDLLWQAVTFERDAERVGSKVILGRSDMGYSKKKLRPQKGTGRARMGDRGNPIRHDGGLAHNRHAPNDFATGLPSSTYSLALRTALSEQYRAGRLFIIDGEIEFGSSHSLVGETFLKEHGIKGNRVTFVVGDHRANLFDATSDCIKVDLIPKEMVNVQDILRAERLFIEKESLQYLIAKFPVPEPLKPIKPLQPQEFQL
ncbi:54S ribosomal protein YmL6, mitochondrial [Wickerhamiella sorbophila]|uniref:Large ribosomal subunit protein uL4m n=1 Tax=Wickerhamiella sorbophila TaxID=45607 RepID=A0A2T0FDI3_9ASCO|nr:54S ribosomal protein YmL6, mitochondrial [Wickerhamiella sorbophila]PRT53030.1 54S ribosomal protein YmL6, mitochondrial [Wickerhamiella sorbophila]